jgi:hypothetical protein
MRAHTLQSADPHGRNRNLLKDSRLIDPCGHRGAARTPSDDVR